MAEHVLHFGMVESWHRSRSDPGRSEGVQVPDPSRRRFLGSALGLPAVRWRDMQRGEVTARTTATGFEFRCAGETLWQADTRWLAEPSTVSCINTDTHAEIIISRCTLPGAGLAFGLRLRLDRELVLTASQPGGPEMRSSLAQWLQHDGKALDLGPLRSRMRASIGASLMMAQRGPATIALLPPFSFQLHASEPVFSFAGDEITGNCDSCLIGPATGDSVIATNAPVARLEFNVERGSPLKLRAACMSERFHCRRVAIDHLMVEIERSAVGPRRVAFAAHVARPMRVGFRSNPTAHGGYVTLRDITYAVHGASRDRPSYLLLADRADVFLRVGDTAYQGSATGPMAFRQQFDGSGVSQHLSVAWHGMAMEHEDGISVHISFKGSGVDNAAYGQLEHLLDNVPWHRKRLDLDNATVEFSRPADAMLLKFRFSGYDLARHKLSSHLYLVPRVPAAQAKLLLDLGSQSWSEEAFVEDPGKPAKVTLPARANLAGSSVLAFQPRPGARGDEAVPLKLPALLDRERWQLLVAKRAYASPVCGSDSTPADTSLEIPWRLYISPVETAIVSSAPLASSAGFKFRPLFSLALLPSSQRDAVGGGRLPGKDEVGVPLRAIGSPDFLPDNPANESADNTFRRSMSPGHRNELVWLTSESCRRARLGSDDVRPVPGDDQFGIYVPRPFYAERLLLTSFGASMRSAGVWDPPSFKLKTNTPGALNIQAWEHRSTLAREHYNKVVEKGFLLPYGHHSARVTETTRELRIVDGRPVAVEIQRTFLSVLDPEKNFPAVGQPTASLYQTFQPETFKITLPGLLQLDDPSTCPIDGKDADGFWIRVGGQNYPMPVHVGRNGGHAIVTMAFVSNKVVHDVGLLDKIVGTYNKTGSQFDARGARVRFAPESKQGDASFVTRRGLHKVVIAQQLVNSVLLESARPRQPPFYPVLDFAEIELTGAGRVQGNTTPPATKVRYADVYRAVGFGADAEHADNPLKLFLELYTGVPLDFTGKSERSGAIATPNMTATAYSRSHGLVAQSALPPNRVPVRAALAAQPLKLHNPFDTNAKLLGLLPLSFFFESVGLGELPQLVENVAYRIDAIGEQFADATRSFLKKVANSVARIRARLTEAQQNDPIAGVFLGSAPGVAFTARLEHIQVTAGQADTDDEAALLKDVEQVARDLQLLQHDVEALAELPQVLAQSAVADFVRLVSTAVPDVIEQQVQQQRAQLLATAARARDNAADLAQRLYFEAASQTELDVMASYLTEVAEARAESIRAQMRSSRAQLDSMAQRVFASKEADQFMRESLKYLQLAAEVQQQSVALREAVQSAGPALRTQIIQCANTAATQAAAIGASTLIGALHKLAAEVERWLRETVGPACAADYMRIEPLMRDMVRRARVITSLDNDHGLDPVSLQLARLNACRALLASIGAVRKEATGGCVPVQPFDKAIEAVRVEFARMQGNVNQIRAGIDGVVAAIPGGLNDFATNEMRAHFVAIAALGRTYDFKTYDEAAMVAVLDAVTGALDRRLASSAATATIAAIDGVQRGAADIARQVWPVMRAILGFTNTQITDLINRYNKLPQETQDVLKRLLGQQVFADLITLRGALDTLLAGAGSSVDPGWVKLASLPREVAAIVSLMDDVLVHLSTALRGLDRALVRYIQEEVSNLVVSLIPARTTFTFDLNKDLDRAYGGVFLPGLENGPAIAKFTLGVVVDVDLMQNSVKASLNGTLETFRINLMSVMILPVEKVHFSAGDSGGFHLDPPVIRNVRLLPPLDFIAMVQEMLGLQDGLFVTPGFNNIRAGYRFARPLIQALGVTIQNLVFEAAMEIPFDDRPALFSVAVGTRNEPCLISVGAYGGGFFLELVMAGTHLVSIESDFCFGLVGAFSLAAVRGSGRIVVEIHYRQASGGSDLSGFFYAGGSARVLNIVSISADLHVPLFHSGSDKSVSGASTFGVTIGVGIFKWTLHFPVSYALAGVGFTASERVQIEGAQALSSFPDTKNLLDERIWHEYLTAFDHGGTV